MVTLSRVYRTIALAAVIVVCAPAGAQVLLTPAQALKEIFPEMARSTSESRPLPEATRRTLEKQLGRRIDDDSVNFTSVFDAKGSLRGYAVVTEEIGKYRPITFMVGVTPELKVRDVSILVYRESRGGEVKRKRFLSQYRGKSSRDPIDLNRDIINISGATISVRSLNAGVKRVLAELGAILEASG